MGLLVSKPDDVPCKKSTEQLLGRRIGDLVFHRLVIAGNVDMWLIEEDA
jgi:hypothetical protein